jgi:hypothetical protein
MEVEQLKLIKLSVLILLWLCYATTYFDLDGSVSDGININKIQNHLIAS